MIVLVCDICQQGIFGHEEHYLEPNKDKTWLNKKIHWHIGCALAAGKVHRDLPKAQKGVAE